MQWAMIDEDQQVGDLSNDNGQQVEAGSKRLRPLR